MTRKRRNALDDVLASVESSGVHPAGSRGGRTYLGSVLSEHNQGLLDRLRSLEALHSGSLPVRELDTTLIQRGPFCNRFDDAFDPEHDPAFRVLCEQIQASGGNVSPILVRPVPDERFELVFGERRWRACARLGFQVKALVADLSDEDAAIMQHHENTGHHDLSVMERAYQVASWTVHLARTPSAHLASRLGITANYLSRLRRIASLPRVLIDVHPSIRSITRRDALALVVAYESDPDGFARRIEQLRAARKEAGVSAADATALLLGHGAKEEAKSVMTRTRSTLRIAVGSLSKDQQDRLAEEIKAVLNRFGLQS